ncbi:MAG: hydroxyacylglutathione hydrolase family protein [Thermoplasmata archaeon]|nr:hydroxyacylglutathione hydrolase family protein [Thermoplasmata archaeon]
MLLEQFVIGPLQNFTYLVADAEGGTGAVIDPSYGVEPVLEAIDRHRVKVRYIFNTHSHQDHTAGNGEIRSRTGAKVVAHKLAPLAQEVSVDEGDHVEIERMTVAVLYTPGHTQDSVTYRFEGHLATGDTLFVGECGAVRAPGGDPRRLYDSLQRLAALEPGLIILPGHDYGATPTSTVGREREENYTLKPRSREEFARFMAE